VADPGLCRSYLAHRRKNQRLQAASVSALEREVALRTSANCARRRTGWCIAAKMAASRCQRPWPANNQPLTAMQMQLGSLRPLLDSGRQDDV
jgi:two-component system C4-dicarboxylate transport sensor histidine kinase DctB